MKIKEILQTIEQFAPLALQESYDNCGVQIGNVNQDVTKILLSIDVTENVIDEAISLGCNLIISHHPIAFRKFRSLTGKNYEERCMIKACKHDIVLYAAHTNLDNATGGISYKLAELIGLEQIRTLDPIKGKLLKLSTFAPTSHAELIRNALFDAGAGNIGNYNSCSYNTNGFGTFNAGEKANPFVGEINELHIENEVKIEVVLPTFKQTDVLRALLSCHPYEEPAYDFYALENIWNQVGSGVVGTLPEEMEEEDFLYMLKDVLKLESIQHSIYRRKKIIDVALCGGSGAFLIPKAISYGADIFITGEAKYNDFYDVEDKILLATIGHYESEICSKDIFRDILTKKYSDINIFHSRFDTNPVKYL